MEDTEKRSNESNIFLAKKEQGKEISWGQGMKRQAPYGPGCWRLSCIHIMSRCGCLRLFVVLRFSTYDFFNVNENRRSVTINVHIVACQKGREASSLPLIR